MKGSKGGNVKTCTGGKKTFGSVTLKSGTKPAGPKKGS